MSTDLNQVRNIGIAAHIDAGKTTTTERILFYTGRTHRMGEVDDGTTTTDFDEQEQQRGITIYSAAVTCPWKGYTINLIDTPGHVDFTAEVERSLRVLDGMVAVFDAKEGVEAQSETVWRQATKYDVPRLCLINKMDKMGADFAASIASIKSKLDADPVAIQIPIGAEGGFVGLIDLVKMEAVYFPEQGQVTRIEVRDIPDECVDEARRWRSVLEERLAETSEALMDKFVHETSFTESEIQGALRKATVANQLQPVLCGSALKYKGVRRLLDAVCDYLPSPLDLPPIRAKVVGGGGGEVDLRPARDEPFAGLVFKIVAEKPLDVFYVRIYSGSIRPSTRVLNASTEKKENVTRILRVFAKRRDQLDEACAGDIVAFIGLKNTLTGHTLCDPKRPVMLEHIEFPETVISRSVEPRSARDRDKLITSLRAVERQDPTFLAEIDEETGQMLISGMGELHLDVVVKRLETEMNVKVRVGRPRVSYRETITRPAEVEGRFVRQTGGRNHFAVVRILLEPVPRDTSGKQGGFVDRSPPGCIRQEFVRAVEQGVRDAALGGIVNGSRVIDWRVTLLDAQEHDQDSSEMAFDNAGRVAFENGMREGDAVLLEPIMKLEVVSPDEYFGTINGDLNARRAVITGTDVRGQYRVISAEVPVRELFGYTTHLRSLSQGRATSTMEMSHYAQAPVATSS